MSTVLRSRLPRSAARLGEARSGTARDTPPGYGRAGGRPARRRTTAAAVPATAPAESSAPTPIPRESVVMAGAGQSARAAGGTAATPPGTGRASRAVAQDGRP